MERLRTLSLTDLPEKIRCAHHRGGYSCVVIEGSEDLLYILAGGEGGKWLARVEGAVYAHPWKGTELEHTTFKVEVRNTYSQECPTRVEVVW